MSHEPPSTSASILVLHSADLDPYPFLARLTGTPESEDPLRDHVPWTIDNKYYTAEVAFWPHALGELGALQSYPVFIYLFDGMPPNPLPPSLTRLAVLDPPPDISLAVRVQANAAYGPLDEQTDERFDEIGMEVVDETGVADDDDERPLDPLETLRQTLMTHMWPNMRRKATGTRRDIPRPDISVDADASGDENAQASQFPVSFSSHVPPVANAPGPASDFPTPEAEDAPSRSPLGAYALLPTDGDDFGAFESGRGPGASEYARLDAWLDEDGDGDPGSGEADEGEADRHIPPTNGHSHGTGFHQFADADELPGFDDDFGPPPDMQGDGPMLPLDPTPLLLHLQQVRADLADVEDEDERRRRAAEEVSRVMAGLGFGEVDWDDSLDGIDSGIEGGLQEESATRLARLEQLEYEEDARLERLQRMEREL